MTTGLTCLAHGSEVTGPVRVSSGASLFADGTTIVGPVSADRAARVEVSESKVVGPVVLSGGSARVSLVDNWFTGRVTLTDNSTGDTPIVVAANTIVGPLACSGNEPPPVNNGQPNVVSGPVSGQCRDL